MLSYTTKVTDLDVMDVKDYLRVDFTEDDMLLSTMLGAAQSFIQSYLNRKFTNFEEIPSEFTIACLALVAHWYERREIQPDKAAEELSYLFAGLLDMHRSWNGSVDIEVVVPEVTEGGIVL